MLITASGSNRSLSQLAPDDAWRCPHCKKLQQGVLKLSLWTLPDILILHLKRFRQVGDRRNKLSTLITFPHTGLDMTPHVAKRSHSTQGLEPWHHSWTHTPSDVLYDLYAVCNHHGGLHGGHYTAYCRNSVDGQWYSYDDSSVDLVLEEEICTKGAYILFYQRRNAIPPWSANSSVRGSISSSVSEHWLMRMNGDSKRGSMVSRASTILSIPDSPVSPVSPVSPTLPVFPEEPLKDDRASLGGFEVRPFIRGLQGRSVSMRSPAKPKEKISKLFPLRWSFNSKDRRRPAPEPAPTAPNVSTDSNPPSDAPVQLVEYLESGRRPRLMKDPIAALLSSTSNKESVERLKAPEGQKAAGQKVPEGQRGSEGQKEDAKKDPDGQRAEAKKAPWGKKPPEGKKAEAKKAPDAQIILHSSPQVAEGQQRESRTNPGQRSGQKDDGTLTRRSTRRSKQDQERPQNPEILRSSSSGGTLLRRSRTTAGERFLEEETERRRDELRPQDGVMAFLKGGFVKRDPGRGAGDGELLENSVPGERSISRLSLPSRSGVNNSIRTQQDHGVDIKRSQSSSNIPRRSGESQQRAMSLQRNGVPGRISSSEKNSLKRSQTRYSSSSTLGRRRPVPESSF
ncbi:ubiquitin carboxyl-terminal hydrolase 43-like [Hoplias malabaricus]|uniref:ubiquitin carboxyl-terminal hydrolase 43-like n=1 Tax=Hoplias malabaricus TaxID=27720 RepID=UPI003462EFA8